MKPSRRTAGSTVLLLACALGTAACDSDPAPAAPPASPSAPSSAPAGPRTTTTFTSDRPLSADALDRAAEQLRHRAELIGLADPKVTTADGTLTLSVAGPVDGDRIAALAHRPVLELRPVLAAGTFGAAPADRTSGDVPAQWQDRFTALDCGTDHPTAAPPGAAAAPTAPGTETVACSSTDPAGLRQKFLLGPAALQGSDIAGSTAELDPNGAGWQVHLRFTPAGGTAFADLTGRISVLQEPANQLAVLVDGAVLSHPYVSQAITGGQAVVSGSFDEEEARELAAQLATPALPADLRPGSTTTIGSTTTAAP
ncbi:SecDF P1 head subdomain-containing protein [Kitasatospora phosalacinea]|uniref:SecDF P1 head subdomain domain-containing protein n=1 Tax=Kitasatospora phosalacinea TaxID=2065 RepID=A0A9W6UNJ5_9ACTN|nr:hypothetical protein [Kitasatospora phosalacinea]GLW54222.1 hypothetical protein Kpho01_22330 [Kitasatospora phosalacinea]